MSGFEPQEHTATWEENSNIRTELTIFKTIELVEVLSLSLSLSLFLSPNDEIIVWWDLKWQILIIVLMRFEVTWL